MSGEKGHTPRARRLATPLTGGRSAMVRFSQVELVKRVRSQVGACELFFLKRFPTCETRSGSGPATAGGAIVGQLPRKIRSCTKFNVAPAKEAATSASDMSMRKVRMPLAQCSISGFVWIFRHALARGWQWGWTPPRIGQKSVSGFFRNFCVIL